MRYTRGPTSFIAFVFALTCSAQEALRPAKQLADTDPAVASKTRSAGAIPGQFGWVTDKPDGWHWYFDPIPEPEPEPAPEPKPEPPPVVAPAPPPPPQVPAGPAPLSAEWIRQNMQPYLDRAMDNPTPSNVQAVLYLQRLAMDKSSKYADVTQAVTNGNPFLDEVSRRPTASFGTQLASRSSEAAKKAVFASIGSTSGIWYFFRSDCKYCERQGPILRAISEQYNIPVIAISIDGGPPPGREFSDNYLVDSGQSVQLAVKSTPAIFLVQPKTKQFAPIVQGLIAADELLDRFLIAAHASKWITEEQFASTRSFRDPTAALPPGSAQDPIASTLLADPITRSTTSRPPTTRGLGGSP